MAALQRFGSGWAWLGVGPDGKLVIGSTPNQVCTRAHVTAQVVTSQPTMVTSQSNLALSAWSFSAAGQPSDGGSGGSEDDAVPRTRRVGARLLPEVPGEAVTSRLLSPSGHVTPAALVVSHLPRSCRTLV
eukprot:905878-Rhodomonas_salina.1